MSLHSLTLGQILFAETLIQHSFGKASPGYSWMCLRQSGMRWQLLFSLSKKLTETF